MQRILVVLFLLSHSLWGQTTLSTNSIDFGTLINGSQRFQDLIIRNPGKTAVYILRVEQSPEVVYKISSDIIYPDSAFIMRFQVNPRDKGPFNFVTRIYFSDRQDPVEVRLKGTVKEYLDYGNSNLTRCPDFNAAPSKMSSSDIKIITVDKETGDVLSRTSVAIIRNGEPAGAWITGMKGSFQVAIPSGYFYFLAAHEGYLKKEAGVYVGPEISEITIPLSKDPRYSPPSEKKPDIIAEETEIFTPEQAQVVIDQQMASQQTDSVIQQELPDLAALPTDDFSANHFKDVNVIFVLDISSSMKMGDKMELLKYSLNQLVGDLRTNDVMGLVTYSDNAEVFQAPTSGDRKEILQNSIGKLQPKGMTAGGKGIKLGYKQVMQQYDASKANMVIVITDGAFNKDSDDYQKTVRKYAKKGVVFSVVGIQSKEKDAVLLTEAARFGNGRFVPINQLADAHHNLLQEIRIASFKGKKE